MWYDVTSLESYHGGQRKSIDAPIHKVGLVETNVRYCGIFGAFSVQQKLKFEVVICISPTGPA